MGGNSSKPSPPPSPPPPPPPKVELDKPWRNMPWEKKADLEAKLMKLTLGTADVRYVKILLIGEVGVGKSSFINSVNNAFQGRITSDALAGSVGTSFTKIYKAHYVKGKDGSRLPFVFNDIMGLESSNDRGVHVNDILSALKGFLEDGYKFNPANPATEEDSKFKTSPSISDQTFCLVSVLSANSVSLMNDEVVKKMIAIREEASLYNLPQVVIMTKVDELCPLVNTNLRKVYTSIKIEETMKKCSHLLGIPLNHIFPVKNYHKEIDPDNDMDVLIFKALEQMVNLANDALHNETSTEKPE